jgi:hypothetical protein
MNSPNVVRMRHAYVRHQSRFGNQEISRKREKLEMGCPVCGYKRANCSTLAAATSDHGWCPHLKEFLGWQAGLRAKWWRQHSKDSKDRLEELSMRIADWAEEQRAEKRRAEVQEHWEREQGC